MCQLVYWRYIFPPSHHFEWCQLDWFDQWKCVIYQPAASMEVQSIRKLHPKRASIYHSQWKRKARRHACTYTHTNEGTSIYEHIYTYEPQPRALSWAHSCFGKMALICVRFSFFFFVCYNLCNSTHLLPPHWIHPQHAAQLPARLIINIWISNSNFSREWAGGAFLTTKFCAKYRL